MTAIDDSASYGLDGESITELQVTVLLSTGALSVVGVVGVDLLPKTLRF